MLTNGFDPSKPLPPQVNARQAAAVKPNGAGRQRPIVNGRRQPGLTTAEEAASEALASVDENYGEIVRRVMKHLVAT
jgi:hypothetical protein